MKWIVYADPRDVDLAVPSSPQTLTKIMKHYPLPYEVASNVVYHNSASQCVGIAAERGHVYPDYGNHSVTSKWPVFIVRAGRAKVQYGSSGVSKADCAFSAGPLLVEASRIVDIEKEIRLRGYDPWNPYARTAHVAIGLTPNGDFVHGVWDLASLYEVAQDMLDAGCHVVMKCDGGGSVGRIENGKLQGHDVRKLAAALVIRKVKMRGLEPVDVVLDPGHGGNDPGAVHNGHFEKVINLQSCLLIDKYLKRAGLKTALTRTDDSDTTLAGICDFANARKSKILYSEHHNWFKDDSIHGREYFTYPNSVNGLRLAECIESKMKIATEQSVRRFAQTGFYVLKHTDMPAILFEGGFMTNPGDLALMTSVDWLDRMAFAKALGIIDYLKGVV